MVAENHPEKVAGHFQNFCFKELDHLAMLILSAKPKYIKNVDTIHIVLNNEIKLDIQQYYQQIVACFPHIKCLSIQIMDTNFYQVSQVPAQTQNQIKNLKTTFKFDMDSTIKYSDFF